MSISYTIEVDYDYDGHFSADEALTADVISLHWRLGLDQPYASMAAPGTAQIVVRNHTRAYSPEHGRLHTGQRLRIVSTTHADTCIHFTGHIDRIEPQAGDHGTQTTTIHAVDTLAQLQHIHLSLAPLVAMRTGEAIQRILQAIPLPRPALKGRWLLGRSNHSELDSNTRLPAPALSHHLDTGQSVLAYAGDTWADGISAQQAIRQLTETERGRFYIDREGQAIFFDRHALMRSTAIAASFADDMVALTYAFGDHFYNTVRVRLTPRSVGSAASTLWQLDAPQRLPDTPDELLTLQVHFRDAQLRPCGALHVEYLRPTLDFLANTEPDATGHDLTDKINIFIRQADFSRALLEIRNVSGKTAWLLPGMKLRGTPLYQGDPLIVEHAGWASVAFHGIRPMEFDLPMLSSIPQAEALARFELACHKNPRGNIHTITLAQPQHTQALRHRTLFERISITESQTGNASTYLIIGESHSVTHGGYRHQTTWTLEDASAYRFWLLGRDRLNQTTALTY